MIIAIDIRSALKEKTGKGFYALNLVKSILKANQIFHFILYSDQDTSLFEKFENATLKVVNKRGLFWHWKVFQNLKKDKIDLFWSPTSFIIPFLLGQRMPYIITVHDVVAFLFPSWHNQKAVLIEKFTLKRALKHAKKIFAVSENTKKDLIEKFGIEKEKIVLTYNSLGIKNELRKPENKKTENQILSTKYILSVGTLEPRKNQIRLIRAFDQIKDEFFDLNLFVVGGKGWGYEKIFAEVKNRNLGNRVNFLGYIDEKSLSELYRNAELFAFPSIYEGFGIPVLEAMSYGCPVLTSNNSSLIEVAGDAAILINAENVDEIAEGLRRILKNENLRKDLIKKGFEQVKKFSWEKSAKVVLNEFKSICENSESPLQKSNA